METRIAETFLKVAELGNVTRAAEQLGYSQATVSAQIQQLEKELRVQLFDRFGRGIQLTDAGRRFIPYASRLVKASEDADQFMLDQENPSGPLIILASSSISSDILPKFVPKFRERYPNVTIAVRVSDDTDILIGNLRQNIADVALFINQRIRYDGCVLEAERIEPNVFVAHVSDPITKRKNVPLEEIFDGTFVDTFISSSRDTSYNYVLEQALSARGIHIRPGIEFGSTTAIVRLLMTGHGRSFLPRFVVEDEIARGTLAIIDTQEIDVNVSLQLARSENKWVTPQMRAFIRFVREEFDRTASLPTC